MSGEIHVVRAGSQPGGSGPAVLPALAIEPVLAIAVVAFERRRVRSVRGLWDHATLTAQLGIPALVVSS